MSRAHLILAWTAAAALAALPLIARADDPPAEPESQPTTRPESQPTTQPESQPASQPASAPSSGPASRSSATTSAAATTSTSTTGSTSAAAKKKEEERFLAIINGRVHTITGPVLERATVLSRNGVITAIGADVALPQDCEVVDARGMWVYPGLVAASSGGLLANPDAGEKTNVYALQMTAALAAGVTTVLSGDAAGKLSYGIPKGIALKDDLYVAISYARRAPLERAQLRADLDKVEKYARDLARYERDKKTDDDAKPPAKDWLTGKYENYRKLLARQAVAVTTASDASELVDLAELSTRYGFRLVIRGMREGWTVAPRLARADLAGVVTARDDAPPDDRANRETGSSIENPAILADHGVTVAVSPASIGVSFGGLAGSDLLHLNIEAAFAVRGGMSNDEAIRTITIDAARVLGVDDRVGSLEVGKDMDAIVTDGDLLHYMTLVQYTVVNGRVAYDKSKEPLLRHVRPGGERKVAEFDDIWPRRLEWRD